MQPTRYSNTETHLLNLAEPWDRISRLILGSTYRLVVIWACVSLSGCHWYQTWRPSQRMQLTTNDITVRSYKPLFSSTDDFGDNADLSDSVAPEGNPNELPLEIGDSRPADAALDLDDVLNSVDLYFPQIRAAVLQADIAAGNLTASMGFYDVFVNAMSVNQPVSFYENYRHSLLVSQNVMENGSNVYAGYRVGRGQFEPWYKERETNEGGEFAVGSRVPLVRNRLIDPQRARVFRAEQDLAAAAPFLRREQNQVFQLAKFAYWSWVGAGQQIEIQRELLALAKDRVEVLEARFRQEDVARLVVVDNQRLIAQREAVLVESIRAFEAASIRLSFFLRDSEGNMMVPDESFLPEFPDFFKRSFVNLEQDIGLALSNHPELEQFDFELEKQNIEIAEARNEILGILDGFAEASQHVGAPTSPLGDKSPFEVRVGLSAEVPVQRRLGLGRTAAAQARRQQMLLQRELLADQIKTAVQDTYSAMERAIERFEAASKNVELAQDALRIARAQYELGDVDLIILNIYEQALADAEILAIRAEVEFFFAEALYQLSLGQR